MRGHFCRRILRAGMQAHRYAGGNHNLLVTPTVRGDTALLARQMGRGLIVSELMGQG